MTHREHRELPINDGKAEKLLEADLVSPDPNLIQIPIDTLTRVLDEMTRVFSHMHISPSPALPAQQGYFPDVLRVVESVEASSKVFSHH